MKTGRNFAKAACYTVNKRTSPELLNSWGQVGEDIGEGMRMAYKEGTLIYTVLFLAFMFLAWSYITYITKASS